ncbi:hypothetical protein [Nocardia sp. NPDC056000]|uniref:hypothetical protein n=1 Tax=Nocardia sp. NPDC056000 TaxID=3345674 RepID=UPI0035D8F2C0
MIIEVKAFRIRTAVIVLAAVLLTGCVAQGPDRAERESWSRVIATAIRGLPGVADASHGFQYHTVGGNPYYTSRLDVELEDEATPDEAAAVVRAMGAQQLPEHYQGDSTLLYLNRGADVYSGSWRFGKQVDVQENSASTWVRVSAAGTGAEIHWSTSGFKPTGDPDGLTESISVRAGSDSEPHRATAAMRRIIREFPELASNDWKVSPVHEDRTVPMHSELGPALDQSDRRPRFPSDGELELWEWLLTDKPTPFFVEVSVYDPIGEAGRTLEVSIFPPAGKQFSAAQVTQLADRHLRYLARPGAVVDYTIHLRQALNFAVMVGGCQSAEVEVAPESQPYVRQYERC